MENGQEIPAKVDAMADGTFVLTDGHRRYKALQVCEDSGMEVYLYAIVNKVRTTEEQRILQMFVTQDSKQLNASETAELFKRLENLGWTQEQIAKKVGKTQSYVSQMLSYANESPVIKAEVEAGNLTVANVLQMQKEHESQEERIDTVKEVVKRAKDEDVSTGKIISSDNKFKKAKRIAEEIITCYPELESQDVTEMANIIKKLL
jgi:ParB family chromosome partitioning protein